MKKVKFNVMNVVKATGGGLAGAFLCDKIDDADSLADKPMVAPLIVVGAGTVLEMFMPQQKEIAYGIMGAGGALLYPEIKAKIEEAKAANGDTASINREKATLQRAENIVKLAAAKAARRPMQLAPRAQQPNMRVLPASNAHKVGGARDTSRVGFGKNHVGYNLMSLAAGYGMC